MPRHLWVVEIETKPGKWEPDWSWADNSRSEARRDLKQFRHDNPRRKYRLKKYEPSEPRP